MLFALGRLGCLAVLALNLADKEVEEGEGAEDGEGVGDGDGIPDTVEAKVVGEDEDAGDEEEHLAGEAHEDALACVAYALEEVADDHLGPDEGEHHDVDAEASGGHGQDLLRLVAVSVGEEAGYHLGAELANEEADGGDACGCDDGYAEGLPDTVVLVGSPVVAHDGLHALVYAHDDHEEEEDDSVDDTIGSEGVVASVLAHALVDEQHYEAGAGVEEEGGEADDENLAYDLGLEAVDAALQMNELALPAQYEELHDEADGLGEYGGPGGSGDAGVHDPHEEPV